MRQGQEGPLNAPASAASLAGAPCLLSRSPWPVWLSMRARECCTTLHSQLLDILSWSDPLQLTTEMPDNSQI